MSVPAGSHTIRLVPDDAAPHPVDDNVDVEVVFESGEFYVATFFTIDNLRSLLRGYRRSGECANGLYVWAADMIVIDRLSRETIGRAVADLIESGEFESAFSGPYRDDPDS